MDRGHVVFLDDDDAILKVVTIALEAEGYAVATANSCSAFVGVVTNRNPDIFLLDVRLPDGNGMQIARDLRAQSRAGIILVTGESDATDKILGLEMGADDYIVKPFNLRELRARVNAVFRRTGPLCRMSDSQQATGAGANAPQANRFHGLQLDLPARRLTDVQGQEIALTTLEFDVLAALLHHGNRVLSRDQIMDHVRGPGWSAYDRSIDGLVSRLRKKLYPDGSGVRKIRTVRGIGYMLSLTP